MKQVWKFVLYPISEQQIWMPRGAQLLSVQEQHGQIMLWAMVDDQDPGGTRTIQCYGTGHMVGGGPGPHIATVVMNNGLVWHFFDGGES